MLQIFADDSGSSPNDTYFVLGGLVSTVSRWEAFKVEWNASLDHDGLEYFKASEANSLEGAFKRGWNHRLADQKMDELGEIAAKHAQLRIHAILRWADFNTWVKSVTSSVTGAEWTNPYFLCFFTLAARFARYCHENNIDEEREFVFDEQGKTGEHSANIIRGLQANKIIMGGFGAVPRFESDKKLLPLQAADLYAWNMRDYMTRGKVVPENQVSTKKTLFGLPAIDFVLTPDLLADTRAHLLAARIRVENLYDKYGFVAPR
jgi:hypothetical protein